MPRRRATRAQGAKSKPKVHLDSVGDTLTEDERNKKIDVYLQDLTLKVVERKKKLERDLQSMLSMIDQQFLWELSRMPTGVRKMTLEDFIKYGGTVDLAQQYLDTQEDTICSTVLSAKKVGKTTFQQPNVFETITEEEDATPSCAFTQPRTALRRGRQPINTPMSHVMRTPAMGNQLAATGWETPLVTPKFDPRNRRGTVDHLVRLEAFIRETFAKKEHLVAVFFDLEKTYDTTWQYTLSVEVDPHCDLENVVIPDNLSKSQITQLMGVLQDFIKKAKN
ncbi:borealin-like [Argopecten irradians]|uniref:borealin-like n=1 Tax=Argopecten irradians TaxID=31199 RepID=UPI00371C4588